MEWESKIHSLYESIVARIPIPFRSMVKPLLRETAEKKCRLRNSSHINEADLITALMDITPGPFKSQMTGALEDVGIDVARYAELTDIQDRYNRSWQQFQKAFHPGNYWFTLYLTDRCNQKCLHCAADLRRLRPELSAKQWIAIIENLENGLRAQERRGVYIWFGGEAACRSDLRDLIQCCGEKEYFHAISTNGILFDDSLAAHCATHNMSHVFVSLDSTSREKADMIRGVPGAFDAAESAIKTAVDHGFLVVVTATVMKQNIDELEDIKGLIEDWGGVPYFRAVIKQRNAAENWDGIGLSPEDYKQFYHFKYKEAVERIRNGEAGTLPIFSLYDMTPFMEQPVNDTELTAIQWGVGCQACRTISGIDINGDVFPCDYPSQLTLGNALTQDFREIMDSPLFRQIRDRTRNGPCADCHHLDLCGGGCRVHAESETGDFFASFSYCWHQNDHQHIIKER